MLCVFESFIEYCLIPGTLWRPRLPPVRRASRASRRGGRCLWRITRCWCLWPAASHLGCWPAWTPPAPASWRLTSSPWRSWPTFTTGSWCPPSAGPSRCRASQISLSMIKWNCSRQLGQRCVDCRTKYHPWSMMIFFWLGFDLVTYIPISTQVRETKFCRWPFDNWDWGLRVWTGGVLWEVHDSHWQTGTYWFVQRRISNTQGEIIYIQGVRGIVNSGIVLL